MTEAPYTDDLVKALESVTEREGLADLLRQLRARADSPSLRSLEKLSVSKEGATPLSRSAVSDMLRGIRFPRKGVVLSFVQACGGGDVTPWLRAWERIAASEQRRRQTEDPSSVSEQVLATARQQADLIVAEAKHQAAQILARAGHRNIPGQQTGQIQECAECAAIPWTRPSLHPNYDHVHGVNSLPNAEQYADIESYSVTYGYAVGFDGRVPQTWVFFEHLEPALVFGRAGRMSTRDISSYGVFAAVREVRYNHDLKREVITLLVSGTAFDREEDEAEAFVRWLEGCRPESADFEPGDDTAAAPLARRVAPYE
ncbi:hypothetical protein [Microbispora sp. NPDC046933]|uniref:hypothetical protein n=1 Tax=Microbispora sp. NPDC046933 TaxID=3155618 RepID=UPI0033D3AE20